MDELEISVLETQIGNLRKYETEIQLIDKFLKKENLVLKEERKTPFWNHFVQLFSRIDRNEMHALEIDRNFVPEQEAIVLTRALKQEIMKIREFNITEFEQFLILVYIQMLINEREDTLE